MTADEVEKFIQKGLTSLKPLTNKSQLSIEAAFYGASFTELPEALQSSYLKAALMVLKHKRVHGIRLSTRPDSISPSILKLLKKHKVVMVELGAQSMDDEVLRRINREHTSQDIINAVNLLRSFGFRVGLQLMIGLPGENEESLRITSENVINLSPDVIRLHPTLVLKDTSLEKLYSAGQYKPLKMQEAIEKCKKLVAQFEQKGLKVIRIGLQASASLESQGTIVAGPYHPAFGQLVRAAIFYDLAVSALSKLKIDSKKSITLKASPSNLSYLLGIKKENISRLQHNYGFKHITVKGDKNLSEDCLSLQIEKQLMTIGIKELNYRL